MVPHFSVFKRQKKREAKKVCNKGKQKKVRKKRVSERGAKRAKRGRHGAETGSIQTGGKTEEGNTGAKHCPNGGNTMPATMITYRFFFFLRA